MNNLLKITTVTILAVTTTACGASTGGLTSALAQKAASQAVTTAMKKNDAHANDFVAPEPVTMAAKPGDAKMSCEAIERKVAELDAIIIENGEIAGEDISMASRQAATAGVAQAALSVGMQTGMAKAVPFLNMFGQKAAEVSANAKEKKVKKARKDYQKATSRRATLMGVHAGKGCGV